ncbi:SH3 domain containing protein [Paecilomyces variotii No. 5]|uniref:SH3 domain containing protein n=1 Tax=Byssochlamys spectabilis (strain No. 5 / NBRC 109023) TaxID=1356009 RepID=V5G914_BYSSN|nr:SH3 domain containing protein [Paecilomyces variotii No. 5]
MQAVHRQFGRFMKRSPDDSQVSVLLKDFEDADELLGRIIDSSKAWRDAWTSILTYQSRLVTEFEGLYAPVVGSSEGTTDREPYPTPEKTLVRTTKLREEYEDLRKDLMGVVNSVDDRMIRPASQAKDYLTPMKKTIKKREDTKLDFEHYQNRVDNSRKKTRRSDRDNAALAKTEAEWTKAKDSYNAADDNLRQHLPGIISVTFSLIPQLLAAQIEIQNTLLAHCYTSLHNYCGEEGFPSPPAEMDEIIQVFETDFLPVQQEIENFNCIANAKSRQQSAHGGSRRPSSHAESKPALSPLSAGAARIPSSPSFSTKPRITSNPSPSASAYLTPSSVSDSDYSNSQSTPAFSPAAPKSDYFARDRQPSAGTPGSSGFLSPGSGTNVMGFVKKKPPPPPPSRAASSPAIFVTALYDFGGQGAGDLAFREGDRIRVLKRTESTDDWWQGELRGVKGSFPANYCE